MLEDNARTPSGVSYMLENRETMMQLFRAVPADQGAAGGKLSAAPAPVAGGGQAAEHQGAPTIASVDAGQL